MNSDHTSAGKMRNLTEIHSDGTNWFVNLYFVLISCGALSSLIQALALVRNRRNGILSLVLQIALVDVASLYVATTEIYTLSHGTWLLPSETCPFYGGMEVLVNTLTIYLLVCFNFHVISTWNFHELEIRKNNKNPLTLCDNSDGDSSEYLVAREENVNRLVTIDYRKRKNDISIVFPTIFVWTVSLSLSIPNFTLPSTLRVNETATLCAIVDVYYVQILQYSLLIFKICIPVILLLLSLIMLIIKWHKTVTIDRENILTKNMVEIKHILICGILLTSLYCLTSLQRQFFHFIHAMHSFERNDISNFKMPPLSNDYLSRTGMIYLAMLHYGGATIRSLCFGVMPKFTYLARNKIFVCFKMKQ